MPVKLRLRRQGRSKAAHYAVVAADVRSPRDGRYIEKIGYFDPLREPAHLYLDEEAAIRWLNDGAQPTHTVRQLLRHAGVTLKHALIKQGKTEDQVQAIFDRWYAEKQKKKKRIMVRVDAHGNLLEELPEPAPAPVSKKATPSSGAEAVGDEAVPLTDAAAAEATEEAPKAEAAAEEAPAAEATEEAPKAEAAAEEAPAAEDATEEAPAEEEEKKTEE